MGIMLTIQINSHYRYLSRTAQQDDNYNNDDGEEDKEGGSSDRAQELIPLLASTSSGAMMFVSLYTMVLATGLAFYGSTAIVGFTSLRGVYIAPCFPKQSTLKIGLFGGAVIVFANLLMLCAVIFGEIRVEDYLDGHEKEDMEPYAVERIATVLACTCMFLSVLYAVFAILLFLAFASDVPTGDDYEATDTEGRTNALAAVGHHHEFITMNSSR
eukprot:CAMPEP_0202463694 /NCGR_PEP_ID=MMETSP1360-20130828/59172_1 /ASSEMBLY_ACC=CAM_ASM_000848 /TAXON_ID=515479 /ORGANISM="Licmophora paradoxa, Strain CCMP2313" /LENGTH=213 /DNA_ID=CAMNT_0049086697 /DNA_START=1 /DNA_END=642 /DNA_ORIENTATION=+